MNKWIKEVYIIGWGQKTKVKGEIIGSRIVVVIATICVSSSCSVAVKGVEYVYYTILYILNSGVEIKISIKILDRYYYYTLQSWGVMNLTIKQH